MKLSVATFRRWLLQEKFPWVHILVLCKLTIILNFSDLVLCFRWAWHGLWSVWNTDKSKIQVEILISSIQSNFFVHVADRVLNCLWERFDCITLGMMFISFSCSGYNSLFTRFKLIRWVAPFKFSKMFSIILGGYARTYCLVAKQGSW